MIQIDKNIPRPRGAGSKRRKYPWDKMEVGDSFMFEAGTARNIAYTAVSYANKTKDGTFTSAAVFENGEKRFRAWRIK